MGSLVIKAKQIGMISENQAKYLWSQLSALGYRMNEPQELNFPKEQPSMIKEIIEVHKNTLGYTDPELSQLVRLTMEDFILYFQLEPRRFQIIRGK